MKILAWGSYNNRVCQIGCVFEGVRVREYYELGNGGCRMYVREGTATPQY